MEIKFNNVSYKDIIHNLDLNIESGKIIGIVGQSGSGKTTIAELIDALIYPTKGEIKADDVKVINNKDINKYRSNIGLVFENSEEQIFNNTVYDEIAFGMKVFNYKKDKIDERVKDALKMVNLDESFLNKDPFKLSSGEMKKVTIASILAYNPKIIILDEPWVSLDYKSKKQLIRIIKTLKQRYNKTIVIVSNNTEVIHKIGDYIYIIKDGRVVKEGKKYEVFKNDLSESGVAIPKVMEFSNLVLSKKEIKLGYRDDINDLIKDIYRHVK
jgi:energy-coupling factor transport system ATP-binding protein